ncbi:hypothetical protein EDB83DRAFT_2525299 [Lactarius deliciosus]|nr:hypothetical protein EDB83DRAFT_2525299 [Lactarius deliciosus]
MAHPTIQPLSPVRSFSLSPTRSSTAMATAAGSTKALPQDTGLYCIRYLPYIFPPHTGNDLDWSPKLAMVFSLLFPQSSRRSLSHADLQLDGVEFSSLPSGLHLVEQDVVYFMKDSPRSVCVFTRRQTSEQGQRAFRLSSLSILLARSLRPPPWSHVPALKALVRDLHSDSAAQAIAAKASGSPRGGSSNCARHVSKIWAALARDIDDSGVEDGSDGYEYTYVFPTLHLPHLLRVLGPSSLMLYKHALGRRRMLIYTQPRVEAACFLCQVAADKTRTPATQGEPNAAPQLKGKYINVLGIVTPHDIDMLECESQTGRGWIARTTDAVSLEKPQYYDLIDLTSYEPTETELGHILQLDGDTNGVARAHRALVPVWAWVKAWGVYEDVCVVCVRSFSGLWRSSSTQWNQWTAGPVVVGRVPARTVRAACAQGEGIDGRRASYRPHDDDVGKDDSSDEDEDGAVLTRFLSRLATVHSVTASFSPGCAS